MTVIGVTGDAAVYCLDCARRRYGGVAGTDREGNELHAVFSTDERDIDAVQPCGCVPPYHCDACFGPLAEVWCVHEGRFL